MRLTDFYGSSEILSASLTSFILATEKKLRGFSINVLYISFLSTTCIMFFSLHSNLLLYWHDFRDINVTLSK